MGLFEILNEIVIMKNLAQCFAQSMQTILLLYSKDRCCDHSDFQLLPLPFS